MKKIFTLAALLVSIISFAAAPPKATKIVINNNDNAVIQVRIDGKMYNVTGNDLVLKHIQPGRHKIEVFKMERKHKMFFKPRTQMMYSSVMMIEPSATVDININRFGNVSVQKKFDDRFDRNDRRGGRQNDDDDYGRRGRNKNW